MSPKLLLIFVIGCVGVVLSNPASNITKCKLSDKECVRKSAESALSYIAAGIPELDIESTDPLFLAKVDADVAGLKYVFTNVDATGYKTCEMKDIKLNLDQSSLHVDLHCKFTMKGNYVMSGRLLILPIEGDGEFSIVAEKIALSIDAEVKLVPGKDDKKYFNIKKFTFDVDALGPAAFRFENLFHGNKELSDAIHKFANENFRDVVKETSGPLFNAALKVATKRVNKFMKNYPFDELTL